MKRAALCVAGMMLFACLTTTSAHAAGRKANVTVHNNSSFAIHNFFVAPSSEDEWGPDQLGKETIGDGGKFTLQQIPCDTYDIKLVDEDGDECVVPEVDICGGHDEWEITDEDLLDCEGYDSEGE